MKILPSRWHSCSSSHNQHAPLISSTGPHDHEGSLSDLQVLRLGELDSIGSCQLQLHTILSSHTKNIIGVSRSIFF